jgi:hypothetical protein
LPDFSLSLSLSLFCYRCSFLSLSPLPSLSQCFRKYHNFDTFSRSQQALRGLFFFNLWLLFAELLWNISEEVSTEAMQFRAGAVLLVIIWMIFSLPKLHQPSILLPSIHPFFYALYGIYLLLMHSYLSYLQISYWNLRQDMGQDPIDPSHPTEGQVDDDRTSMKTHEFTYLFYNGRWSLADALIFVLLCFNTTLRFGQSASLSGAYLLWFTVMPFLIDYPFHSSDTDTDTDTESDLSSTSYSTFLFSDSASSSGLSPYGVSSSSVSSSSSSSLSNKYSLLLSPSMVIIFTFYLLCLVSSQDIEMKLRLRFLKLSELGHALRRRDTLINSILPKEISVALRKGDSQQLSAFYPNVSILFCFIVDFSRHSSISHAEVRLCFSLSLFVSLSLSLPGSLSLSLSLSVSLCLSITLALSLSLSPSLS